LRLLETKELLPKFDHKSHPWAVKGIEESLPPDIGLLLVCLSAVADIKYSYSVAWRMRARKKE